MTRIVAAALVGTVLATAAGAALGAGADDTALLFTSFRKNGQDGLHLAYSTDGLKWTDLGKSSLKPAVGKSRLMRDPCIQQGPNGTFHMVWTAGWWEKGIGHASSKDLITWSKQQYIAVMAHEPKARNTWAPELTWDEKGKQWLIYWATTIPGRFPQTDNQGDHNHRMYYVMTKDFKTFSKTKLFFDPGYNVIDATIVKKEGKFTLVYKDERKGKDKGGKTLRMAYADRIEGPYLNPTKPFTIDWVEGPSVIPVGREWFVYYDHYTRPHYYGGVKTADFKKFTDASKTMTFPPDHRHGTVLRVPKSVLAGLKLFASAETGSYTKLPHAVAAIAACLDKGDYKTLAAACSRKPNEHVLRQLGEVHKKTPLPTLYADRTFPANAERFKLGGHAKELGHIHIDFSKTGGAWRIESIWMCR